MVEPEDFPKGKSVSNEIYTVLQPVFYHFPFFNFFPDSIISSFQVFPFWAKKKFQANFSKSCNFSIIFNFSIDFKFTFCSVWVINSTEFSFWVRKFTSFLAIFILSFLPKESKFFRYLSAIKTYYFKSLFPIQSGFHNWL